MDAFSTPVRLSKFVLAPQFLAPRRRKYYISDSSEENCPLAQPLFDTLEPETHAPNEPDGLTLSVPMEQGGSCESPVGQAEGRNESQVTTNNIASDSVDEPGPACFCSTPIQIDEEDDPKDDAYMEFNRSLGMERTEPVPQRERKKAMQDIVCVAVSATLNYCIREKLFEACEGCVIEAPDQWDYDCMTWSSEDINCKLRGLCAELCFESLLNSVIAISYVMQCYVMQCLCLTQEHLARGVALVKAVQFGQEPCSVLKKMTKPEDACLERYMDRLVRTKSYRALLRKQAIYKKSKRIKLENGERPVTHFSFLL